MSEQLRWRNPPSCFEQSGDLLVVRAAPKTDFWSRTFYGFERRNGHVYGRAVAGDFSLTVTFAADYKALYDQAGAMIRVDDDTWLKAGVELTDGALHVSAVVTRDAWSDWSITPVAGFLRRRNHGLRQGRRAGVRCRWWWHDWLADELWGWWG